jgi:8-oxo-dGTP diphosphatase
MSPSPAAPEAAPSAGPVLGVSVAVWRDGKVLLVQRGHAPWRGAWSLPGGRVERGEKLTEAAARELAEETGLRLTTPHLVEALDAIDRTEDGSVRAHYVIVVFAGAADGTPVAASDAAAVGWYTLDEVDALTTTPDLKRVLAVSAG